MTKLNQYKVTFYIDGNIWDNEDDRDQLIPIIYDCHDNNEDHVIEHCLNDLYYRGFMLKHIIKYKCEVKK